MALKNLKSNTFGHRSACNYKFHLFFYFVNIVQKVKVILNLNVNEL